MAEKLVPTLLVDVTSLPQNLEAEGGVIIPVTTLRG